MAWDTLSVAQALWAFGDVLLTGGAFSLLGVYGGDHKKNCRIGGIVLWTLAGVAPLVIYCIGG